jgi:hypothetical protein
MGGRRRGRRRATYMGDEDEVTFHSSSAPASPALPASCHSTVVRRKAFDLSEVIAVTATGKRDTDEKEDKLQECMYIRELRVDDMNLHLWMAGMLISGKFKLKQEEFLLQQRIVDGSTLVWAFLSHFLRSVASNGIQQAGKTLRDSVLGAGNKAFHSLLHIRAHPHNSTQPSHGQGRSHMIEGEKEEDVKHKGKEK